MSAQAPDVFEAWRRRLAVDRYLGMRVASGNRHRAVLPAVSASMVSLHAWDLADGTVTATGIATDGFNDSWWPSSDGEHVFKLLDDHGDELGHVHRIALDGSGERVDVTPDLPAYAIRGGACSADGSTTAFVAIDEDGFRLIHLAADGATRVVYASQSEAWNPALSVDGRWAALDTTDHNPGVRRFSVTVFDLTGEVEPITLTTPDAASATNVRFAPTADGPRILLDVVSASDGWARPAVWRPVGDTLSSISVPEAGSGTDVIAFDWSDDATQVLMGIQRQARQRLVVHTLGTAMTSPVAVGPASHWLPKVRQPAFAADGAVLATPEDAATPMSVVEWRPDHGARTVLHGTPPPPGQRARSVSFDSADGTTVPAWLITPPTDGPHPTVVHAHGGPHWFVPDLYNPEAQAWVDRGFAWLDVNYRGSTGLGSRFAEQIHGDIGRLELEDLAAANRWLSSSGVADPGGIFLAGESYGGFLTLFGMSRQPELWAAGFASVALADWTLAYADAAPALQAAIRSWFGGSPDELPELYRDRSPLTHAASVRGPIVVFQGRYDTRTPEAQMQRYEAESARLGKDVDVVWFGAGHGLTGSTDIEFALDRFIRKAIAVINAAPSA